MNPAWDDLYDGYQSIADGVRLLLGVVADAPLQPEGLLVQVSRATDILKCAKGIKKACGSAFAEARKDPSDD